MRQYGTLSANEIASVPPDTVQTLLIAASSGQALDWLSSGSTAFTNAAQGYVNIVRISGFTTAGAVMNFIVDLFSTAASAPSSGSSFSSTSSRSVVMGSRVFEIPGGSTGWSVAALSSGYIICEQWRR